MHLEIIFVDDKLPAKTAKSTSFKIYTYKGITLYPLIVSTRHERIARHKDIVLFTILKFGSCR